MAQQIKKKYLSSDAVDGSKLVLLNGQAVRAKDGQGSEVELIKLDAQGDVAAKGLKIAYASDVSALDGRLDIVEGADTVSGSIAKAEKDAKAYADQKVAALVNSAPAVLDTLKELSDALGGDENFATTVSGQIGALDGRIDALEADPVSKSYVDSADQALDGRLDTLEGSNQTVGSVAYAVAQEASARQSADNALDGRLDVLEADPVTKSYVNSADQALDGRLDALEADSVTKSYVDSADQALDGRLDTLEADAVTKSYVDSADQALDGRLDSLEADAVTKSYVDSADQALDVRLDSLEADPVTKSYVNSADNALDGRLDILEGSAQTSGSVAHAVAAEATLRQSADDALDLRLDILEGANNIVNSVDYKIKQAVDGLIDGAPNTYDTLKEIADYISGDAAAASQMTSQLGDHETRLDTLEGSGAGSVAYAVAGEATARQNAIDALSTSDIEEGSNKYYTDARARASITGGASSIVTSDLTASKALVSDGSGKVGVSSVSSTELGYVSGVTSAVQTQLNGKASSDLTNLANTAISVDLLPGGLEYTSVASNLGGSQTGISWVTFKSFAIKITPAANASVTRFRLFTTSGVSGTDESAALVKIYADNGSNAPNKSSLIGTSMYYPAISIGVGALDFYFSDPVALTGGTSYWFALECTNQFYPPNINVTRNGAGASYPMRYSSTSNAEFNVLDTSYTLVFDLFKDGPGQIDLGSMTKNFSQVNSRDVRIVDGESDQYISLRAPSALPASVNYVLPRTDATSNGQALSSNTKGGLFWGVVPASNTLNNLSSTSINVSLNPADASRELGSSGNRWNNIYGNKVYAGALSSGVRIESGSHTTPSGASLENGVKSLVSSVFMTLTDASANSAATGNLNIETGNKTAGTGDSGSIKIYTGTSLGGARGKVIVDALEMDLSAKKITNLADPTAAQHAATKKYVDDINSALSTRIGVLEADPVTKTYVDGINTALDSRLDALEAAVDGPEFYKEKIVLGSGDLSYIDLQHEAVANSIVLSVGRLMGHLGEDFTVSVASGKTRITWAGSFVNPEGAEAVEIGDAVFINYAVLA